MTLCMAALSIWLGVSCGVPPEPLAPNAPSPVMSAPCIPASVEAWGSYLSSQKDACIIFFATWCAACRQHLLEARPHDIVVGVMDDPAAIGRAVRRLGLPNMCLTDAGIAAAYDLRHLPARICL